MSQSPIEGEYYFRRQEMVAGFKFSPDGKFQFFYSYGAVDREATGTFQVDKDTLKLKSDKEAGKDFTVTSQTKQAKGYHLVFQNPNQYLLKGIKCVFILGGEKQTAFTDDKGQLSVDFPRCDAIYAQHPLFPDILTLIKDVKNENNHFTIALNPSLAQVSFKGIDFIIVDDKRISCLPNYFMDMPGIEFVKQ